MYSTQLSAENIIRPSARRASSPIMSDFGRASALDTKSSTYASSLNDCPACGAARGSYDHLMDGSSAPPITTHYISWKQIGIGAAIIAGVGAAVYVNKRSKAKNSRSSSLSDGAGTTIPSGFSATLADAQSARKGNRRKARPGRASSKSPKQRKR